MVKSWIQRGISWLPRSYWWNEQLQRFVTGGLELRPATFQEKVNCCHQHLEHYRRFSASARPDFRALEVGTGWFPVLPVALFLCGADRVWTYDIVPLLRPGPVRQTLRLFSEAHESGALARLLPGVVPARMDALRGVLAEVGREPLTGLLGRMRIEARVQDVRSATLPAGTADLVLTNLVLEHLPRPLLLEILTSLRPLTHRHGVSSHHIGLEDQYASFDSSISPFNFLRYSDRSWRWLNNPMIHLSRLRVGDYREVFREAGYRIVQESNTYGSVEDLRRVPLAEKFRHHSERDLCVLRSWLVAQVSDASSG